LRASFSAKLRVPVRIVSPNANSATIGASFEGVFKRRNESNVNHGFGRLPDGSKKCPNDGAFRSSLKRR
jgi:hypothetical protein